MEVYTRCGGKKIKMKKIVMIPLAVITNVIAILELFLKYVIVDSAGIPANVMLWIQELYNHEVLATVLFLVGLGGIFVTPFAVLASMKKWSIGGPYCRDAIIVGAVLTIDTFMSFVIRCIIGGLSTAAAECAILFVMSEITFLIMVLNTKRSKNNGTTKNGRV